MEFKNLAVGDKFVFNVNVDENESCDVLIKINDKYAINIKTGLEQSAWAFNRVIKLNL